MSDEIVANCMPRIKLNGLAASRIVGLAGVILALDRTLKRSLCLELKPVKRLRAHELLLCFPLLRLLCVFLHLFVQKTGRLANENGQELKNFVEDLQLISPPQVSRWLDTPLAL